jgi:hypothetical protein
MYASGPNGAGQTLKHGNDETEGGQVGVAESAMWNRFLTRVLKAPARQS